jgi:predicted PurR-regulated permease PerM
MLGVLHPSDPNRAVRFSFLFLAVTLVLVGWLHLATPLIAALFSYATLARMQFGRRGRKWIAVGLFLVLLAALAYSAGHFLRSAVRELPEIADKSIPSIIQWAKRYQIVLPFTDYDSLKELAFGAVTDQVHYLGRFADFARGATRQFVFLAVGCVVAIGLFLNPQIETGPPAPEAKPNLYILYADQIAQRFATFYRSFATVMGAQVLISGINTALTALFVFVVHLPYALVVIGLTFLCGLIPVVGNLISNTIIISIGFTISPEMALFALIFLIIIHKLEYFLNSKIIGHRIRNPVWLTLLALVLGERLMGLPGMILAPVVLNYLKLETARIENQ